MENITRTFAANISYDGFTYNTKLIVEYQHTGKQWYTIKKGDSHRTCTTDNNIAQSWEDKGLIITNNDGYYFMKRLAIENINAKGQNDLWYINNSGDSYSVNKTSKYFKKIHKQLSCPQKPILI